AYILSVAILRPNIAPSMDAAEGPASAGELAVLVFRSFLPPVFLMVLVLGSIAFGWATPTEAAGVGALGAILIAVAKKRFTLFIISDVLRRSMLTNAMLFMIFIGAMAFAYVFRSLGGDNLVVEFVRKLDVGPWSILMVMMVVVFLLGFVLEWIEITLIVVPVFLPIFGLLDFGTHVGKADLLYWFAILLAVNMQTSFLTPPFGITLFYMKGVAQDSIGLGDLYRGIVPFVALQLVGLVAVIAFPGIAMWLPRAILN
ncbi:MAG: TRAP transporter large permease subunit, partial [Rhodospirillales bacterium]